MSRPSFLRLCLRSPARWPAFLLVFPTFNSPIVNLAIGVPLLALGVFILAKAAEQSKAQKAWKMAQAKANGAAAAPAAQESQAGKPVFPITPVMSCILDESGYQPTERYVGGAIQGKFQSFVYRSMLRSMVKTKEREAQLVQADTGVHQALVDRISNSQKIIAEYHINEAKAKHTLTDYEHRTLKLTKAIERLERTGLDSSTERDPNEWGADQALFNEVKEQVRQESLRVAFGEYARNQALEEALKVRDKRIAELLAKKGLQPEQQQELIDIVKEQFNWVQESYRSQQT